MRPLKCFAPSCLRVPALVGPCAAQQPSTVAAFTRCLVSYRGCVRLLHPPRHPSVRGFWPWSRWVPRPPGTRCECFADTGSVALGGRVLGAAASCLLSPVRGGVASCIAQRPVERHFHGGWRFWKRTPMEVLSWVPVVPKCWSCALCTRRAISDELSCDHFSRHGGVGLTVGLDDLGGLFQT